VRLRAHVCGHVAHRTTGSRCRVVGQYEEGRDSEEGTESTLEDEKPLPSGKTPGTIQTGKNACGNEAGEGSGENETRVEQSHAQSHAQSELAKSVPAGHEHGSWKQRSLNDAEDELKRPETLCNCASESSGGDIRPEECSNREEDARRYAGNEHVGGQLSQHVTNSEDCDGGLVNI
jgi:hypothetical protein